MGTTHSPPPPLTLPRLPTKESPNPHVAISSCDSDDILIIELLNRWIEQQEGSFLVLWHNSTTILQQGPQYLVQEHDYIFICKLIMIILLMVKGVD